MADSVTSATTACFSFTEGKPVGREMQKQEQLEAAAVKAWQSISEDDSKLQGINACKKFLPRNI